MARIRTVKPDLFINERCAECSVTAVLTFIGLLTQADDQGRHRDNAAIIAGVLWPLRAEHTPVHVEDDLHQLAGAGLICRYTGCDGKRYLHIVGWFEHQKIDKPSQSRLPACPQHHPTDRCGPCRGACTEANRPQPPSRQLGEGSPNPPRTRERRALPAPAHPHDEEQHPAAVQERALVGVIASQGRGQAGHARQGPLPEASPRVPRGLGEDSAPGSRILDPGSVLPSGRSAPAATASAGDLIAEYVTACAERPPADVLGHLGRLAKRLLTEGIAVEHVRAGLRRFAEIQGHPSRLPSLVNDSMNAPRPGLAPPGIRPNVPAHQPWTTPVDAAAYAEEL
ncbi:hypothetical protein [Streptomyces specialis]|uniref:hypothetical protein n=1 Tax=Streptomyces specialis TaxID=498367 RepID=UPI00073F2BBE|nr:hypothetical protein [Streptomyces specialis]